MIGGMRAGEPIGTPAMTRRPAVLFISQLGLKGGDDARIFCRLPGGDDETVWVRQCLSSLGLDARIDYRGVRVDRGEALPAVEQIDAVILGGSIASVHDDEDWQIRTKDFLRAWRATGRPWFGICGGHQLASVLEGGTVEVNPHGATAGSYPVTRTAAGERHFLFDGFAPDAAFHFSNGDRVDQPPPGAVVLATRPGLPAAALDHGGNWYSVQFHPEATADLFGIVWSRRDPAKVANYRLLPGTERMLLNFLTGTGVLSV
jgi:GMP synthase-like glutamine amidotransferase